MSHLTLLSLSLSLWVGASSPKYPPASVFAFCFMEESASDCRYQNEITPEMGKYHRVFISESEFTKSRVEESICHALTSQPSEFTVILLSGKGVNRPSGWYMDWVDQDGRSGSISPISGNDLMVAVDRCLVKKGYQEVNFAINGCHRSGDRWPLSPNSPKQVIRSMMSLCEDDVMSPAAHLRFSLISNAETHEAKTIGSGPLNQPLEDLAYLPLSISAPRGCRAFWKSILALNLVQIMKGEIESQPEPTLCKRYPPVLAGAHRLYESACFGKSNSKSEEIKRECLYRTALYHSALTHWNTRDQLPAMIEDTALLTEKLVWLSQSGTAANYETQSEKAMVFGKRLMEVAPQSENAKIMYLNQLVASAVIAKEEGVSQEALIKKWEAAESLANTLLAQGLTDVHAKEMIWYALSHGMEPDRTFKLANELILSPVNQAVGHYLLARYYYFKNELKTSTRHLERFQSLKPGSLEYREAKRGAWFSLGIGYRPSSWDLLSEAVR